jgi:hypothetical protein
MWSHIRDVMWFFCLPVKLKLWGEVGLPDHAGWSELLFSPSDSCVTLHLQLFGQLLSQWGWAVKFVCCPLVQEIISVIHYLLCFGGGLLLCLFTESSGRLVLCPTPFLWGQFSMPPVPSVVHVWLQFAVCFSVLWDTLVLDAALWLRRSALWSTTCPALGSSLLPAHCQPLLLFLCLFTEFGTENLVHCLWCRFSMPPAPSAVCARL